MLELADIFRTHGEAYRQKHALTGAQAKAMRAIETCRTAALGGHLDVCDSCGHERPAYNSCRDRNCPKCQALTQDQWIEGRTERILPTHYFHCVFTLPSQLRPLARRNPALVYNMLFRAASRTLLDLGRDPKRLGAMLGITMVLHTWSRTLAYHPHVHCIVTGGGLAPGGQRWVSARGKFLFPVRVISALFRGKFLALLAQAYNAGSLDLGGVCAPLADPAQFAAFKDRLYRTNWVVYAKRPFGGPEQVVKYLGRYTHRVGISNHRLRHLDDAGVCFDTKNGNTTTLPVEQFIARFLQHVLPSGFVKIRHFGLLSSTHAKTTLPVAQRLLRTDGSTHPTESSPPSDDETWQERLLRLTGIDITACPHCRTGRMVCRPLDNDSDPLRLDTS